MDDNFGDVTKALTATLRKECWRDREKRPAAPRVKAPLVHMTRKATS